jgi:hypothetical protein
MVFELKIIILWLDFGDFWVQKRNFIHYYMHLFNLPHLDNSAPVVLLYTQPKKQSKRASAIICVRVSRTMYKAAHMRFFCFIYAITHRELDCPLPKGKIPVLVG